MDDLLDTIQQHGWASIPSWLDTNDASRLQGECQKAWVDGSFHAAGVGRGGELKIREDIRGDQVMWLDPENFSREQQCYLAKLEQLRLTLNKHFFLGLADFEGHFAIYKKGAFYKAHLDRHAGTSDRLVTVILYLNESWQPGDGGELKLWTTAGDKDGDYVIIEPRMGTLVCFLSGDFWHEVLPAMKSRMSITGWFRQRS
jgi:SM-20-related protein